MGTYADSVVCDVHVGIWTDAPPLRLCVAVVLCCAAHAGFTIVDTLAWGALVSAMRFASPAAELRCQQRCAAGTHEMASGATAEPRTPQLSQLHCLLAHPAGKTSPTQLGWVAAACSITQDPGSLKKLP